MKAVLLGSLCLLSALASSAWANDPTPETTYVIGYLELDDEIDKRYGEKQLLLSI